jgi:hypothetical protein
MPHGPKVGYADGFDGTLRARVDEVLRELSEGDGSGSWDRLPSRIEVVRTLGGGLSGSLVVSLEAHWEDQRREDQSGWFVAKIDALDEMRKEWAAYKQHVQKVQTILYAPIAVVTRNVLGPNRALDGEDAAVLYRDVGDWTGADTELRSLEQVVAAALSDHGRRPEAAVGAITTILRAVADVFCANPKPGAWQQGRASAKTTLGPDIRIAVTAVNAEGRPDHEAFAAGPGPDRSPAPIKPDRVVAAGLVLPDAESRPDSDPDSVREAEIGEFLTMDQVELTRKNGRLFAERHEAVVEIVPDRTSTDPALLDRVSIGTVLTVRGKVLGRRSLDTWKRAVEGLPGLAVIRPGEIELDGVRAAHPFAALRWVVRDRRSRVLAAGAHGDLNALNVLVVGELPFVIDYARAGHDQPVLKDPAWLELNLLRHPLGDELTFPQLVRVQRLLLLGDRVADLLDEPGRRAVTQTLVDLAGAEAPAVGAAVEILAAVRRGAQRVHRHEAAGPWWSEYQVELLLAAHRAFKWSGEQQTAGTWRAQIAAAAVASEALVRDGDSRLRFWPDDELTAAATKLLPLLPDAARAVVLLAEIVSELTARQPSADWPADLRHEVRAARARISADVARAGAGAQRLLALQPGHDLHMDLPARVSWSPSHPGAEAGSALEVVLDAPQAVILGPSGSGKTALRHEACYRLLDTALNSSAQDRSRRNGVTGRLPVSLRARDLVPQLTDARLSELIDESLAGAGAGATQGAVTGAALLAAGAVHLLVDDLHLVAAHESPSVLRTLRDIRARFADVPVTLAVRGTEPPGELSDWSCVRLRSPTRRQAARYLTRSWRHLKGDPVEIAGLVESALANRGRAQPGADSWNPRLLTMLAELAPDLSGKRLPRTWGDILDAHYESRLAARPGSLVAGYAEDLARLLTDAATDQATEEQLRACGPSETGRPLVDAGILVGDEMAALRFESPEAQDYFAARWLCRQADRPDLLRELTLSHRWYGPVALLVSLTGAPPRLREDVVGITAAADPVQTGRLLGSFVKPPRAIAETFLARQDRVLRDAGAGRAEHLEAADALAAAGAPAAYRRLFNLASDKGAPVDARVSCLHALAEAWGLAADDRHRAQLADEISACCAELLGTNCAGELAVAALQTVATLHLIRLGLMVAAYCTPETPWPVARAALATLDALNLPRTQALEDACRSSRMAGLAAVECVLYGNTADADFGLTEREAQTERLSLLAAVPAAEKLGCLLARRFSFEIGELVGDLIDRELAITAPPTRLQPWEAVLRGGGDTPELLDAIRDADSMTAAAGLHRLLRTGPDGAVAALRELARPGETERAGQVAAVVRRLPPDLLPEAVAFARSLPTTAATDAANTTDAAGLEGIASLVHAIFVRNPGVGAALARQIHRSLVRCGRRDRYAWPWATALRRCAGTDTVIETLLRSTDESDRQAALDILGDHVFLLLGAPGPGLDRRVIEASGVRIAELIADAGSDEAGSENPSPVAVLAAATGIGAALPALRRFADEGLADAATAVTDTALPGLGIVQTSTTADSLAAAGYLARRTVPGEAAEVHRWLVEFDTSRAPVSVEIGRLTGLAYLGDWLPLLAAVPGGEPRLSDIAHNAVAHWLDGPCPPLPGPGAGEVAGWISSRLADADLGTDARSALFGLRRRAEERAGSAVHRFS